MAETTIATVTAKVYESDVQRILDDIKGFIASFINALKSFLDLFGSKYGFENDENPWGVADGTTVKD